MRIFLILLTLLFSGSLLTAQSKKAIRYYNQAREDVAENDYMQALRKLGKALDDSPEYIEAMLFAADIQDRLGEYEKSLEYYEQALQYDPPFYVYLFYGKALFNVGRYTKAREAFAKYAENPRARPKYLDQAKSYMRNCDFAIQAQGNPKTYNPQNLGPQVNTDQMEYFPSISADGSTLVFTHRNVEGENTDEDFWVTVKDSATGSWSRSEPLRGYLNTRLNEGAQTITSDGQIIYFAACERRDGFGSCDIYASFYQGRGAWSKPVNLGDSVNSRIWDSQPSISSDGRTLYFVRGKNSFDKNIDIYYAKLRPDGRWGRAKKLPGKVNTKGQETSPFIHFDDQSLYFSSNGHPGMGDLDFFVSRRQGDGSWGEPQNLGYPINTNAQEFSLIVAPDGKTGYFASDALEQGQGMLDIYSFELPEESRAVEIAYIKGRVINKKTRKPVAASIEFGDLKTGKQVLTEYSGKDGRYFSVLPGNSDYALSIRKQGFLFYSKNFSLATQTADRAFVLNVELIPIEVGERVKLENVFFDYDSYQLDDKSYVELNKVAEFLKENPTVKISLEGHTDDQGSAGYNKELSDKRARSVQDYLTGKGIAKERLSYKGYGAEEPLTTNDTEEGRALNRRTEMKVTSY